LHQLKKYESNVRKMEEFGTVQWRNGETAKRRNGARVQQRSGTTIGGAHSGKSPFEGITSLAFPL